MSSLSDLTPGDIGFGPIHGAAGALVNAGQLLLGEGFHVGRLDIRHVFVVVQVDSARRIWAVEAMPSGARLVYIGDRWTPEYAYVRLPEDYSGQGEDAAAIARAMIDTPYSFASYAALAAWRFGWHSARLEAWCDRRGKPLPNLPRVDTWSPEQRLPREAICSVLADQAWTLAGKKVVTGTKSQIVTPGRLAAALLETPGVQWLWPS